MPLKTLPHPSAQLTVFCLLFVGGLATSRILYEWLFPHWLWLGRPLPSLLFTFLLASFIWYRSQRYTSQLWITLTPLLLNLIYLFDPHVDLVKSRFLFLASLWLTAVFLTKLSQPSTNQWPRIGTFYLLTALLPVYLITMPHTVGRADTFEFQVVIPQLGIVHPTGYPLYLLLGKLFTYLPFNTIAWRINFASVVYALIATTLLYWLAYRLLKKPIPALLGALAFGLTPTFWSQAIEAEVYTLHALIVIGALFLMIKMNDLGTAEQPQPPSTTKRPLLLIAFTIGLGLTNHLTSLFLLPPAILTWLLTPKRPALTPHYLLQLATACLTPLLLYAYLPLRWAAVNGEPMGLSRLIDWVLGGRFQDALQWQAWLDDPTRYTAISRLFLDNWGDISPGWGLITFPFILIGVIYLSKTNWRVTLIFIATWLGYTFYALNYYVPDLAVFIIPAHIIMGLFFTAGIVALIHRLSHFTQSTTPVVLVATIIPICLLAIGQWSRLDRSQDDGRTIWGQGVLAMPLAKQATILADSEKIAPLYYLQQAEGIRPDLNITVLPDEAAYRAALDGHIAAGQTVYLARFLPRLEGIYHLRSVGPLTEVSSQPLTQLPPHVTPSQQHFGPLELLGYQLEPHAAIDNQATAITLYWQSTTPINEQNHIYIRWQGQPPIIPIGQHPANNYYPTTAWQPGEIVSDFHLLPHPISPIEQQLTLQVGVAPPFTPAATVRWQTVTAVTLPPTPITLLEQPLRQQIGATLLIGNQFPSQIRPQTAIPLALTGYGQPGNHLSFQLQPINDPLPITTESTLPNPSTTPFVDTIELTTDLPNGRYHIIASDTTDSAMCGWLHLVSASCQLGQIIISGVPLPTGATNFEDKIALLALDIADTQLQPGGQLDVTLHWQSLAPLDENYTIFIQLLDMDDQIVSQLDVWPLQGTYPTSQWPPGETVTDPHTLQLSPDLPAGTYRLQVGWYLLATSRRLPIFNEDGLPIDDKLLLPNLFVPPSHVPDP